MLRKPKRPAEREVPAWKLAMLRDDDDDDGGTSVANDTGVAGGGEESKPAVSREAASSSSGDAAAAASSSGGGEDAWGYGDDDDDDDDDNFDPRNYDLDAVDDDEPNGEAAPIEGSSSQGTLACRVALANLPYEVSEEAIWRFASPCGRIVNIERPDQPNSKRTGFVTFANEEGAQAALQMSGQHLVSPNVQARPITILLAPIGATPSDDGLKYDLLRNLVTHQRGRPLPSFTAGSSQAAGQHGQAAATNDAAIQAKLQRWHQAKHSKDWVTADRLRTELRQEGVNPDMAPRQSAGGSALPLPPSSSGNGEPDKPLTVEEQLLLREARDGVKKQRIFYVEDEQASLVKSIGEQAREDRSKMRKTMGMNSHRQR